MHCFSPSSFHFTLALIINLSAFLCLMISICVLIDIYAYFLPCVMRGIVLFRVISSLYLYSLLELFLVELVLVLFESLLCDPG